MVFCYEKIERGFPQRMGKLRQFFYFTVLAFLVFQFSSSLFATLEEDELTECLKKRLASFATTLDYDRNETQIQALYKKVRDHYEPLAPQDPEAAITLGFYMALVEDGEDGLSYILPFANQGHAHAQYLTGFFLCQLERKPEAMRALADASIQGHQEALDNLKAYAHQLKDPYALLELSRFFSYKKDKVAEAQCLEEIIGNPVLQLPTLLLWGYICSLSDDFGGALQFYRKAASTEPERVQPYIDHLFQNPTALFQLLKVKAFQDGELEKSQKILITSISQHEEQLTELSTLGAENPDATYIFGCALLERQKSSKNKKDNLFLSTLLDPFFMAARLNHKLAQQKLKQVVDQHKQPELLYRYGKFLIERGDQKAGENYINQAVKTDFKRTIEELTAQSIKEKSISIPGPKQMPKNISSSPAKLSVKLSAKPKVAPNWFLIGCQLEKSKKWEQAIESFKKVASSQRLEASYHIGRLYYKLYKENKRTQPEQGTTEAKKAHESLDLLGDQHPEALYTLGKLFYLEQDKEKAEEKWEAAYKLRYSAALYRLGILYAERKENSGQVRECFREAGMQGVPKAYRRAAWLSSAMGDAKGEAEDLYKGAIEGNRGCLMFLIGLANKKSMPTLMPASMLTSMPALFNLGAYYFTINQNAEARACWDQIPSTQDDPEYAKRLAYNYGQLALREDKIEEALKLFTDSANAGCGLAYAALGSLFWEKKKEALIALEYYQKALERAPKNGELLHNIAKLEHSLGNMDVAVSRAVEAISNGEPEALSLLSKIYTETNNPYAALNLGSISLQNNDTGEAKKYWTIALRSQNPEIKSEVYFNLCMATFLEGDLAKAVKLVQKGIEGGEIRFVSKFIDHLQIFAHSEDTSPKEQQKKERAITVLKKLGISPKEPVDSEALNKELT